MSSPNTNLTTRIPSRQALNIVEVFDKSDIPTAPSELVNNTNYILYAPILLTTGEELIIPDFGNILITTARPRINTLTYDGTGTFISSAGADTIIGFEYRCDIISTGTGTCFNLTGFTGFSFLFSREGQLTGWDSLGTLTDIQNVGLIQGSDINEVEGGLIMNGTKGFFNHGLNVRDLTGTFDLFTFDDAIEVILIVFVGYGVSGGQRVFNIDSNAPNVGLGFLGKFSSIDDVPDTSNYFNSGGIGATDPTISINQASNISSSTVSAIFKLSGNAVESVVDTVGQLVEINTGGTWTTKIIERIIANTDGSVELTALDKTKVKTDMNLNLAPAGGGAASLTATTIHLLAAVNVVTFTNVTNKVEEVGNSRVNGDLISFKDTAGILPTGLRSNVIYHVIARSANDYQIADVNGGAVVTFTDDGTPTNSYKVALQEGSESTNSISPGAPRDVIPQGLVESNTGDKIFLVVNNGSNTNNIIVNKGYQRFVNGA